MADLIIKDWQRGIGPSPHLGFANICNMNIWDHPGIAKIGLSTVKRTTTTVTARPNWIVRNPATVTEIYALDSAGQVYKSADSGVTWATLAGETAGGHGNGMIIWKNYLFVARDAFIDVCGDGTATGITAGNWTNSWKAIDSDTLWHPMLVSKSDFKLYGGAGRYVFSLDEETTFAPGTPASFTWAQQALDLSASYRIKCLEELGNNLMIGTWMGTNVFDFKIADIFPWDRSSPSFDLPLQFSENGISALKTINNILYVLAGLAGHIFTTNGVSIVPSGQIPAYIVDAEVGGFYEFYPGAVTNHKGRLYFGIGYGAGGNGVYSLSGNTLNYEHLISTGNNGSATILQIGALLSIGYANILIGWKDDTSYGIDSLAYRYTGYVAFIESPLYPVGTSLNKRQFTECEFQLVKPLTAGQGVRIKYRTDLSASWTTIGTYDYTTFSGITSYRFMANMLVCEFLQIRVELTTGTNSSTTPELRDVILR